MSVELHELIRCAADRGITLTPKKLRDWSAAGLIDRELVTGRKGRGRVSYYAEDTPARVCVIEQALKTRRDYDYARLALLRAGHDVDMSDLLHRAATIPQTVRERMLTDLLALDDLSHTMLYEEAASDPPPMLQKLRRAMPPGFGITYGSITQLILSAYRPAEQAALSRGMGWLTDETNHDRAILAGLAGMVGEAFQGNPYRLLAYVRACLDADNLAELVAGRGPGWARALDTVTCGLYALLNVLYVQTCLLAGRPPELLIPEDYYSPAEHFFIGLAVFSLTQSTHASFRVLSAAD